MAAILAGCHTTAPPPADSRTACCSRPERFPPRLVHLVEPAAPLLGATIAQVRFRPGHLGRHPEAVAAAMQRLKPLDLVVLSSKGRLSGNLIPGRFGHVAIYLGTEAQLRRAGVWDRPELAGLKPAIRAGKVFIEADHKGIHLSAPERIFNTDRAALLRPGRLAAARQRQVLTLFAAHVGEPFDYHFDSRDTAALYCAELADHVMELKLRRTIVYDRPTILPDAIVRDAMDGRSRLALTLYLAADRNGWDTPSTGQLAADLARP